MKKTNLFRLALLMAALPFFISCEPSDPGSPMANQAPDTRVSVAPVANSNFNHYVSPEIMFRLQWFGSDPDGIVNGYYVQIDNNAEFWTTRGDSALIFQSAVIDPNDSTKTLPALHTVKVTAVDNLGVRDPSPATRTFSATNYRPEISDVVGPFENGKNIGPGVAFEVKWGDRNPSGASMALWIDGVLADGWDNRSQFQFCKSSDAQMIASIDPAKVRVISTALLTNGAHQFTFKVKDAGGAVSDSVTASMTVNNGYLPTLSPVVSTYRGATYYPDGSIFFSANAVTEFQLAGEAVDRSGANPVDYSGSVEAYRWRLIGHGDTTAWSRWGGATIDTLNLSEGNYTFEAQCRDWSGAESVVKAYAFSIINASFATDAEQRVLVIDETFDGNGNLGSPDDGQQDAFWRYILDYDTIAYTSSHGWKMSELDYATHTTPSNVKYISPRNLADKDVVIWHSDDKSEQFLKSDANSIRLLKEYLDRGGRLLLCGWDLMSNFTDGTVDTSAFSGSEFPYKYLRVELGTRSQTKTFGTAIGQAGYADLHVDATKIRANWNGKLDKCWAIKGAHRTVSLETWSGTPFDGVGVVQKNFSPILAWRTVTCGFPLYFIVRDEAKAFVSRAVTELLAP